ncbi:hypothetical protein ACFVWN_23005 [Nocardiopsis flavescens]|uniref:Uncharacterized protein n=1 Tax=Nocardiopsis flavescens TaxID=758803 RepID=A0A1M6UR08_9ACTN|nr:hypothetical protein [Nocardiopsis flavescens]SHK71609.1 hypothetical protein SAMN05421803_12933 [Nocardiopsis flavescens]
MTPEPRRLPPERVPPAPPPPAEAAHAQGALPRRSPSPVPRGPRPGPGVLGPDPAEPGPLAALRRLHRAGVPLERVRRGLQELNDESGAPGPGGDRG